MRSGGFEDFLLLELYWACQTAKKGKRKTQDEYIFEMNEIENLLQLRDDILNKTYRPGRGIAFVIRKPVIREIFAAPFRDRVVHHLLYNYTYAWWETHFCVDSYSCQIGKGPFFGMERLQRMMHQAQSKWPGEKIIIWKFDLSGFFMSLNRKKLFERVNWGLEQQYPKGEAMFDLVTFLWKQVLFDDPTRGVRLKGQMSDWNDLPSTKTLFTQPKGFGIVIGNLTSQLVSNIYMDEFDWYVKKVLGYDFYGRYVDDFFILVPESQMGKATENVKLMKEKLELMDLRMHPDKHYIQEIQHGADFLGARVYPDRKVPGKRILQNFRMEMCKYAYDEVVDMEGLISFFGHFSNLDYSKRLKKMLDHFGVEYWNGMI